MKRGKIIHIIILLLVVVYLGSNIMVNSPLFRNVTARFVTAKARSILGSNISVGDISLVRPSGINVEDIIVLTPSGDTLSTISSATVRLRLLPLTRHQIDISGIRLLNPDIRIWKDSVNGEPNYQFILDSLANGEKKRNPLWSVNANSIIIRNGHFSYDILDQPVENGLFTPSHIGISGLTANVSLKALSSDTASLYVRSLRLKESSGLGIDDLRAKVLMGRNSTDVEGFRLQTASSLVYLDRVMLGIGMDGKLQEDGQLNIRTHDVHLKPSDFSPILPELRCFDRNVILDFAVSGTTDSIGISRIKVMTRDNVASITLSGLVRNITGEPSVSGITLGVSATDRLYDWLSSNLSCTSLEIPEIISRIGKGSLRLTADGDAGENSLKLNLESVGTGPVTALFNTSGGRMNLDFSADSLNLRRLTGNQSLGKSSVQLSVNDFLKHGNTIGAAAVLNIPYIDYGGYRYSNITLNAALDSIRYDADLKIADRNVRMDLTAGHTIKDKSTVLRIKADNIDLAAAKLVSRDSISSISGSLTADITGLDADRIRGTLTLDTVRYTNSNGLSVFDYTELKIADVNDGQTMTTFTSDAVNATLLGEYSFRTLPHSAMNILRTAFPAVYGKISHNHPARPDSDNRFELYVTVSENEIPWMVMNLPLVFGGTTVINASADDRRNEEELSVSIPSLSYRSHNISDFSVRLNGKGDSVSMTMLSDYQSDKMAGTKLYGIFTGNDNRLTGTLTWNGHEKGLMDGNLVSDVRFGPFDRQNDRMRVKFGIEHADITYNHADWHIGKSEIVSDSGRYDIRNLRIANAGQYIMADGSIASDTTRTLDLRIHEIDLKYVLAMLGKEQMNIDGMLSGDINARAITDKPIISGNISAEDLNLLGTYLNGFEAEGRWNGNRQLVELNAEMVGYDTCHTFISGIYSPQKDSIDLAIEADRLNMYFLNTVLPKNTITELRTMLSGSLRVFGNLKQIDFSGRTMLEEAYVDVAANHCRYFIPRDSLLAEPGLLMFRDLRTYDELGNSGIVNIGIRHNHLKNFRVSLDVETEGIEVFNITQKETSNVSGKIVIGGHPVLSSVPGRTTISGQCSTANGTWLKLNLGFNNANKYNFLTIKDASTPLSSLYAGTQGNASGNGTTRRRRGGSELDLNIGLEVTDDALIYASMNSVNGSVRGYGDLLLKYGNRSGITASGTYNINRGNCTLSLQQVLRKEFNILDNSRITFNGDIQNTVLDVHASHTVNSVSLYDLDASLNSSSSRVKARCLMDVGGTASNPQLSFNVDLPQASAEEKELITSVTGTEEQRNMQFMYLLAIGKFYTYDYADATTNSTTSAMQSLINSTINGQINNFLSQVINSNYISLSSNLNTGYLSNDPTSYVNDTFEGILEAHLLDNRLTLNGNFGYRKDNLNQTSSIIGDFELKWLMLPRAGISLIGYNRNNQRYFTKTTMNTQGFGISYQNEFNSLRRRKTKKSSEDISNN